MVDLRTPLQRQRRQALCLAAVPLLFALIWLVAPVARLLGQGLWGEPLMALP